MEILRIEQRSETRSRRLGSAKRDHQSLTNGRFKETKVAVTMCTNVRANIDFLVSRHRITFKLKIRYLLKRFSLVSLGEDWAKKKPTEGVQTKKKSSVDLEETRSCASSPSSTLQVS